MASKRCKIHYRKLRREGETFPQFSLSSGISKALSYEIDSSSIASDVRHRIAPVASSNEYQRVAVNVHVTDEYLMGDICLFSPGQMQALLSQPDTEHNPNLDETIRSWMIQEQQAPNGYEYLQAIGYWLAIGDHFYQIQHVSLQARAMEEYFTWLLRNKTSVISENHFVELQAAFDLGQIGTDLGDVKSIEIGGLVSETMTDPQSATVTTPGKMVETETHKTLGDKVATGWSSARKIIEQLFGDVEANKLIESVPDQASLEVKVNIGYRAKTRKFNKEFMKNLASGLRNIPDGELRVRGKDGEIKGDDARLSLDMSVKKQTDSSSLLDFQDAHDQMLEVHRRFLHDGKIHDN